MGLFSFFSENSDSDSTIEPIEPTYDRFSHNEDLTWANITFIPIRYEVWREGQKIKSGKSSNYINVTLDENGLGYRGLGQLLVHHTEKYLFAILDHKISFDMYGSQGDRRILFTVPTTTNVKCMGMRVLQMKWPNSRHHYNFNPTEPYCCSVFTVRGEVAKMTFHLDNPETMVEFYGF